MCRCFYVGNQGAGFSNGPEEWWTPAAAHLCGGFAPPACRYFGTSLGIWHSLGHGHRLFCCLVTGFPLFPYPLRGTSQLSQSGTGPPHPEPGALTNPGLSSEFGPSSQLGGGKAVQPDEPNLEKTYQEGFHCPQGLLKPPLFPPRVVAVTVLNSAAFKARG